MVCQRCISTIKTELESLGIQTEEILLGEVTFSASPTLDITRIEEKLKPLGFSILEDKRASIVKKVKQLVEEVYSGEFDFPTRFRFSELAVERLHKDYDTISSVFSSIENITIEKYIINLRIEKTKELLVYTSQTLTDISFKLGFSSVAHLSRQFKTVTGFNPSHYRDIRDDKQKISNWSAAGS